MATLKGVALAVRLDEFKIEQTTNGPKVSLRTSLFAEFDKKANKAIYNRVIFTTKNKYRIDQLSAIELPTGRLDKNTVIHLTIPYANLHFNLWQGPNGPGLTGWAYIDGEVSVAIPSPKPARSDDRHSGGNSHPDYQMAHEYAAPDRPQQEPARAPVAVSNGNNSYRPPWKT